MDHVAGLFVQYDMVRPHIAVVRERAVMFIMTSSGSSAPFMQASFASCGLNRVILIFSTSARAILKLGQGKCVCV